MTHDTAIAAATGGEVIDLRGAVIDRLDIRDRRFSSPVTIRNGTIMTLQVHNCAGLIFDDIHLRYQFKPGDRATLTPFHIFGSDDITFQNGSSRGSKGSGDLPNGRPVTDMWWGTSLAFRNCLRPSTIGWDARNTWQGISYLNCHHTVTKGCRVQDHGDDAVRLYGGDDHLVEGCWLLDADPPPRDHPQAFHPDAVHVSLHFEDKTHPKRVTIRDNWLSSLPSEVGVDEANCLILQSGAGFAEGHVISGNVVYAGGASAIVIEEPVNCLVINNTILDRDGVGPIPMIQLRYRGRDGLSALAEGNVTPRMAWINPLAADQINYGTNHIVGRDQYATGLVMDGPFETWRAVPGGPFDGVGSPLLWARSQPEEPAPVVPDVPAYPDLSDDLAAARAERDALAAKIAAAITVLK